ncbi:hypothetical protein ACFQ2B_31460 [Streptomyces stramineus]|uniref:Uncharacterized protein n=1 Tax=Streptomyces stramineus TaxID=173861 RepID=A0ABN1AXT7_9ACTN
MMITRGLTAAVGLAALAAVLLTGCADVPQPRDPAPERSSPPSPAVSPPVPSPSGDTIAYVDIVGAR